jgi:hypothetical protein
MNVMIAKPAQCRPGWRANAEVLVIAIEGPMAGIAPPR